MKTVRRLIVLLGLAVVAGGRAAPPTATAIETFKDSVHESYMVVIVPPSQKPVVGRFDFRPTKDGSKCWRTIVTYEQELPAQELSADEADRLLKKFRAFNWNAVREQKKEFTICSVLPQTRITFRCVREGIYHEIGGEAESLPSLITFVDDVFRGI